MRISRIVDILLFFKSNGTLSREYYNQFSTLNECNTTFYNSLSSVIQSRRKYGIEKTTIDEFLIPKEMWDCGIWEKNIMICGTAICEDSPGSMTAADIEVTIQTGCSPLLLSGRDLDYDSKHEVIMVRNIDVSIDCNSLMVKSAE